MKAEQQQKYRMQLLKMEQRLAEDIEELGEEIVVGGQAVGEDSHARKSTEAEWVVEKTEAGIQQLVKRALVRIETDAYGACEDCGGKIAKARLDAIPYTPFCIQCETRRETS